MGSVAGRRAGRGVRLHGGGCFGFYGKEQSLGQPASPFENARVLPPRPRLQVEPRADLHAYCVQQLGHSE